MRLGLRGLDLAEGVDSEVRAVADLEAEGLAVEAVEDAGDGGLT